MRLVDIRVKDIWLVQVFWGKFHKDMAPNVGHGCFPSPLIWHWRLLNVFCHRALKTWFRCVTAQLLHFWPHFWWPFITPSNFYRCVIWQGSKRRTEKGTLREFKKRTGGIRCKLAWKKMTFGLSHYTKLWINKCFISLRPTLTQVCPFERWLITFNHCKRNIHCVTVILPWILDAYLYNFFGL